MIAPLSPWHLWLLAARPKTLPAAIAPVLVGTAVAMAEGGFHFTAMLVCLFFALTMQIGANLANDYFDWKRGIDATVRLGPRRFCQAGLIAPERMKRAVLLTFTFSALALIFLIWRGGWPVVMLGLLSIAAAPAYSGGPYPLASHGLGEVAAFVFFGLVATGGTAFVISGAYSRLAFIAALPPGLLIAAIMLVNNFRDRDGDAKAGKKTLAVMLGREKSILLYRALLVVATLVPVLMAVRLGPILCLPLLTLPLVYRLWRRIANQQGQELNDLLAATAQLALWHSLLFSLGIIFF